MKTEEIIGKKMLIQSLLIESEGEFTESIEKAIEELEMDIKSKIKWMCEMYEENNLKAQARKEKIALLTKQKKSLENTAEWWKHKIDVLMHTGEFKELSLGEYDVNYRQSKGVIITDEKALDKEYVKEKVTYTPNKILIKKVIESGQKVLGAELEVRQNLQIK